MTTIGYLAGYFDADGSVTITRTKNKNGHFIHQVKASVTSVCPTVPELFHKRWGGSLLVSEACHRKNKNNRIRVDWQLSSKGCRLFLIDVLPSLVFRADQAKLAIEMQDHLDKYRGGIKPWDEKYQEVMDYRFSMYKKMRELKAVHYLERYWDVGEFGENLSASKKRIGRPRAKQDKYLSGRV